MVWKENKTEQTDREALPTMLVVASDPKVLKLLTMALSLELACEVFTIDNPRKAEESARRLRPSLLILDEEIINAKAHELSERLHRIAGLEQLPTLFINAEVLQQSERKCYPTRFLTWSWKLEALYAAVRALLD